VPAQVLAERMRANLLTGAAGTVAGKSFSAQSFTRLLQLLNSQVAGVAIAVRGRRSSRRADLRQLPRRRPALTQARANILVAVSSSSAVTGKHW
jgi:hypothetical protein